MPLRIVGRIRDEIWSGRVESCCLRRGLTIESAVAKSAVHGVDLHAVDKILIRGGHGICHASSMTLHRCVEGCIGYALLEPGRGDICGSGEEAEHGEAQPAKYEYQQSENDTENEFPHDSSRSDILADTRDLCQQLLSRVRIHCFNVRSTRHVSLLSATRSVTLQMSRFSHHVAYFG